MKDYLRRVKGRNCKRGLSTRPVPTVRGKMSKTFRIIAVNQNHHLHRPRSETSDPRHVSTGSPESIRSQKYDRTLVLNGPVE